MRGGDFPDGSISYYRRSKPTFPLETASFPSASENWSFLIGENLLASSTYGQLDSLNSMVHGIEYMDMVEAILESRPGLVKLTHFASGSSILGDWTTFATELLDAMISEFADEQVAIAIETDSIRVVELAWLIPLFTEECHEFRSVVVAGDDLDSMVASVGDP